MAAVVAVAAGLPLSSYAQDLDSDLLDGTWVSSDYDESQRANSSAQTYKRWQTFDGRASTSNHIGRFDGSFLNDHYADIYYDGQAFMGNSTRCGGREKVHCASSCNGTNAVCFSVWCSEPQIYYSLLTKIGPNVEPVPGTYDDNLNGTWLVHEKNFTNGDDNSVVEPPPTLLGLLTMHGETGILSHSSGGQHKLEAPLFYDGQNFIGQANMVGDAQKSPNPTQKSPNARGEFLVHLAAGCNGTTATGLSYWNVNTNPWGWSYWFLTRVGGSADA
eukprot:SAG11_NODE_3284_length_2552_cov_12.177742_3_plen_274_part_00